MNIAIDYNGCYANDRDLFNAFAKQARARGHNVYLVTAGGKATHVNTGNEQPFNAIIKTYHQSKKKVFDEMGIHIQIYIDDHPWFVLKHPRHIP